MRWLSFIVLYLLIIPTTVYLSGRIDTFYLAGILAVGFFIAFGIGTGFRKGRFPRRENSLIDYD
jgi:hypothetical protein